MTTCRDIVLAKVDAAPGLLRYDEACRAVAEAYRVDEAAKFKNQAAALAEYARQANDPEMLVDATLIKLRAERRMGEILTAMARTGERTKGRRKKDCVQGQSFPKTLEDLKIDEHLSSDCQRLATIPNRDWEQLCKEARESMAVLGREVILRTWVRESARTKLRRRLKIIEETAVSEPVGKFDVLVIDPPWPMEKIERNVAPKQVRELDYPTMSEADILTWDIPARFAGENCHVFLWATHKFLPLAFDCLVKWGFTYVCLFTWLKPGGFQPFGLPQYNSEPCLYARHGSPKFLDTKRFATGFTAPRGKHSEKPELFYETVRRVTGGRRLDIGNRRKIDGFIGYGLEAAA